MRKNVTSMENEYVRHQEHMHKSSSKRKKRLVRRLSLFFVLVLAISGFMVSTLISRAQMLEEKQAEKTQLENKMEQLKDHQNALEEEIVKLNDDDYIAKLARRDYFLSDDGEIIFNIPEPEKKKE
ncbi:FtsB family cell division protein [Rossellomorea aquimaris]|jgi:cell division protein DivIC|uniref:Cell division protein DIVIC n=1 Tax=Rossellomorea aquimaris TaxID=189382 RepID=A0A1J6WIF8_9BACI|nr:septum formation initiator family protein [Rossellomorea aquimaris]OIU71632.1 cell division protein DIVIC [Rossellomorea aquimaris]